MRVRIPTSKRRHKRVSSGGTSWLWWLLLSGPTLNRWRGQLWKVGPTCWPQAYTRPRRESPFRAACDLSGCPKLQSSGVNLGFPFFPFPLPEKAPENRPENCPENCVENPAGGPQNAVRTAPRKPPRKPPRTLPRKLSRKLLWKLKCCKNTYQSPPACKPPEAPKGLAATPQNQNPMQNPMPFINALSGPA